MISQEPKIRVGILDNIRELRGLVDEPFEVNGEHHFKGEFTARAENGQIVLADIAGKPMISGREINCTNLLSRTFTLRDVPIGIKFHWERKEDQAFEGDLNLIARSNGTFAAVNIISLEKYLASVISSEMSSDAPVELLKAHAITSRSWLAAMLAREERNVEVDPERSFHFEGELIRWYDREDHDLYDVCADDHCQRYQGIAKITSTGVGAAVEATRGIFLVYGDEICDARFSKACGGLTDEYENAWEEIHVPYLETVPDSAIKHPAIANEHMAEDWILSNPDAYCNITDVDFLKRVLPAFDQDTTNFFRWGIEYDREELEEIIAAKSGIDFGTLRNIVPLQRGPSGRICRLKVEGSKKTMIVGKELEIRRWLSKTHLYSSAFIVMAEREEDGTPKRFMFYGAGWGHGVGLCQIGAAVMASKGFSAEEIVRHYFRKAEIKKVY